MKSADSTLRSGRRFAMLLSTLVAILHFAAAVAMPAQAGATRDSLAVGEFSSAFATMRDGARIHYLHGGTESAQPGVVFIPGWTWSGSIWTGQMKSLASSRRVIAIDPRSQGDSSKTADGNTPEGRAQDLAELLEQWGDAPVVLVGWSQGVQDVAAYIDRFGTSRLAGIVLVDSSLSTGPASLEVDPEGTRLLLQRIAIYAEYPREYLAGSRDASRKKPFTASEKGHQVALAAMTPTSTGISMLVSDMLTKDRRGVISKIDKPTLVIASADSSELAAQRKMVDDIPNAKLLVVEDAGHAVFLDQPVEFSRELTRFLDGLAAGNH